MLMINVRPQMTNFFQVLKQIFGSTTYILGKLYLGQTSVGVLGANLRRFFSGEIFSGAIKGHFELLRALNQYGARALIRRDPSYVHKYLRNYLATGFSKTQRREVLIFHHRYLAERRITETFYEAILDREPCLWRETISENLYSMRMKHMRLHHEEGDLSLVFLMNDRELYGISFSIVPGELVGSAAKQTLLIGNIQGRAGHADDIRTCTKALQDVAPPFLLLTATSAIADVLAITTIIGVGNEKHIMRGNSYSFYFDYDAFWEALSVERNHAHFYEGSVPIADKSIKLIKSKKRGKTRLKRQFKHQVFEHVRATFADFVKKSAN
jgi:uncharacterized protein VirK/YbjX